MEILKEKNILPIIVILLSVVTILLNILDYYKFDNFNYLSTIVSLMGIIGGYLYIKEGRPNTHLIQLWLVLQVPYINQTIFETATKSAYQNAIFDVSQGYKINFYLHFTKQESLTHMGINILPLLFIGILMYFKIPYLKSRN